MNLVSWNCNMAFRKKCQHVYNSKVDLMVIQECENIERLHLEKNLPTCTSHIWVGENVHKGVGVFSFNGFKLKLVDYYNPDFKYIIPIQVSGPKDYLIFAIWAMPDKETPSKSYVGQIWAALNYYEKYLDNNTLLVGDFNSNQIWDKNRKSGHHMDVVNLLAKYQIQSLYHDQTKEEPGQESLPTIYLLKQKHKPYHLDYCFMHHSLLSTQTYIAVGLHDDWIKLSDHMPLIINEIK